jgi:hypothetical protein
VLGTEVEVAGTTEGRVDDRDYSLRYQVGLALAVEGKLNPGIFHTKWFVREHLLRAT